MDHRTELRTLVELARLGNVRRTAELLRLSQSTVSEVLARLEDGYGTKLFDRGRHGSRPTATGALVVEAARRSLELLDNAEREVGLLEGFERGALSVAAHPFFVESHLVPAVAAMLRGNANLRCRIHSAPPAALLQALRDQQLELFVGLQPDPPHDDVEVQRIDVYRPVPFCRAGHPLATLPPQGIQVLRRYPLVTTEMPLWYEQRLDAGIPDYPGLVDELAARGRRVQVSDLSTMGELVASTDSLGFAPASWLRRGVEAGRLAMLGVPDDQKLLLEPLPIVLVTRRDRALPPSARAVVEQLLVDRGPARPSGPQSGR